MSDEFVGRIGAIISEIELGMGCEVVIGHDRLNSPGRYYFQIQCWRKDVITGEFGFGFGGKYYLSENATDSELIQTVWAAYQSYWLHEARENFYWRGRRIYGPHISADALWEAAPRVDVRSAQHVEDRV